jgi:hypothetical protein
MPSVSFLYPYYYYSTLIKEPFSSEVAGWYEQWAENILTLWLPIGRGQRIFSHSGFLLVVGREYSHTRAPYWLWAENILTLWLLIGRGQRIFSHAGFLLVVGREYSHTLASYWSWAENILTLWLLIGRGLGT